MGKSRKPRKNFRSNPITGNSTNGDVEISEEFTKRSHTKPNIIKILYAKLQSSLRAKLSLNITNNIFEIHGTIQMGPENNFDLPLNLSDNFSLLRTHT